MGVEYIYIIDHERKSIYVANYQQAINLTENMNTAVQQLVREHLPENLLITSSLQHEESNTDELNKAFAADYRSYFISHIQGSEQLQNETIDNIATAIRARFDDSIAKKVVTARFEVSSPQKMPLKAFVSLALDDKIPLIARYQIIRNSDNAVTAIQYIDIECKHNYVCTVSGEDQFTLRTLAKLYFKQPYIIDALSIIGAKEFEDITYLELKFLLGERLLDFINKINIDKANILNREFNIEQLLKHSANFYFDFSPLERLEDSAIDFVKNAEQDQNDCEGEYRKSLTESFKTKALETFAMQENSETAKDQRRAIRDHIINIVYHGTIVAKECIFPLPRAEQWPLQDVVIESIQFLEQYITSIEIFVKCFHRLTSSLADFINQRLLPLNCNKARSFFFISYMLPIPNHNEEVTYRYSIKLPDGRFLNWSSKLVHYIKFYNVMPTKKFLDKLKLCRLAVEKHHQAVIMILITFKQMPMLRKCLAKLPDQFVEKLYQDPDSRKNPPAINEIIHSAFALEIAHRINDSIDEQSITQFGALSETIQKELKESLISLFQLIDSIATDSEWYPQAQMLRADVLNRLIRSLKLSEYICTLFELEIDQLALNNPLNPQDKVKVLVSLAYANAGIEGKTLMAKMLADLLWKKTTAETKLAAVEESTKNSTPSLVARNYPKPFIEEMRPLEVAVATAQTSLSVKVIDKETAKFSPAIP